MHENRIAIVEDDEALAAGLTRHLQRYGFEPMVVADLKQVDTVIREIEPALILLDINLTYYDGFYWCRRIRTFSTAPVIFLSARQGGMDQVLALENGGDDYVVKPFQPDVLIAKIRALLRRTYGEYKALDSQAASDPDTLVLDPITLDLRRFEVRTVAGVQSLSKTETALLRILMEEAGRVVERDRLLDNLWNTADYVDDNTLTVNVARLRRKLSLLGGDEEIETIRGIGYRLRSGGGGEERKTE